MLIDQVRKSQQEKKDKAMPIPGGYTLDDIRQDESKSHLFGELLKKAGKQDLAERLAGKKLDAGDIALLEKQRKIFSERITKAEEVEEWVTEENVKDLARNHPNFASVVNLANLEGTIEVIKSQLKEMSIVDETRFNKILGAIKKSESLKGGEYKKVNDEVEKLCKDNNIKPQEYLDALAIEDPREKEKALRELASKMPGKFKKAINWLSGGTLAKGGVFFVNENTLKDLQSSEKVLKDSLAELDTYQKNVGAALFASINTKDSLMNNALADQLGDGQVTEKQRIGSKEAQKGAFSKSDEDDFNHNWESRKEETDYYNQPSDQQKAIEDLFRDGAKDYYRQKNKGKNGFWHDVFAALTEAFINDKKLS